MASDDKRRAQLIADIDGDGTIDALTDGLLFLRWGFGYRGDNGLGDAAISPKATRTIDEIEAYLSDPRIQELLDFDDNDDIDALSDGLMFLRYAFSSKGQDLRSPAMIDGLNKGDKFNDIEVFDRVEKALYGAFLLDENGNRTDTILENVLDLEAVPQLGRLDSDAVANYDPKDYLRIDAGDTDFNWEPPKVEVPVPFMRSLTKQRGLTEIIEDYTRASDQSQSRTGGQRWYKDTAYFVASLSDSERRLFDAYLSWSNGYGYNDMKTNDRAQAKQIYDNGIYAQNATLEKSLFNIFKNHFVNSEYYEPMTNTSNGLDFEVDGKNFTDWLNERLSGSIRSQSMFGQDGVVGDNLVLAVWDNLIDNLSNGVGYTGLPPKEVFDAPAADIQEFIFENMYSTGDSYEQDVSRFQPPHGTTWNSQAVKHPPTSVIRDIIYALDRSTQPNAVYNNTFKLGEFTVAGETRSAYYTIDKNDTIDERYAAFNEWLGFVDPSVKDSVDRMGSLGSDGRWRLYNLDSVNPNLNDIHEEYYRKVYENYHLTGEADFNAGEAWIATQSPEARRQFRLSNNETYSQIGFSNPLADQDKVNDVFLRHEDAFLGIYAMVRYKEQRDTWTYNGKKLYDYDEVQDFLDWQNAYLVKHSQLPSAQRTQDWVNDNGLTKRVGKQFQNTTAGDAVKQINARQRAFIEENKPSERAEVKNGLIKYLRAGEPDALFDPGSNLDEGYVDDLQANGLMGALYQNPMSDKSISYLLQFNALDTPERKGKLIESLADAAMSFYNSRGNLHGFTNPGNTGSPYYNFKREGWLDAELTKVAGESLNSWAGRIVKAGGLTDELKQEFIDKPYLDPEDNFVIQPFLEGYKYLEKRYISGTTPNAVDDLINLGASKRLGDLWEDRKDSEVYQGFLDEYETYKDAAASDRWVPRATTGGAMNLLGGTEGSDAYLDGTKTLSKEQYAEERFREYFYQQIPEYNVNLFVETSLPLEASTGDQWYDNGRLYMKLPGDENVQFTHKYGQTTSWQALNNAAYRTGFENQMPTEEYDEKSPGAYNSRTGGLGYFVDVLNGPVGSYSMMFVSIPEEPSGWVQFLDDLGPIADLIQLGLAIFGGPEGAKVALKIEAAMLAAKALSGQTLKSEDYAGLALYGLMELGKLIMPVDAAEAAAAGEAARSGAEAEAIAKGFAKGSDAYNAYVAGEVAAATNTALMGVGIAGLNAKQTVAVIRAAGSGDIKDALGPILQSFGGGYIESTLSTLGVSQEVIDGLSPAQLDLMYGTVNNMVIEGMSFKEAITDEGVEFFGDILGIEDKAEIFFKDFEEDVQNILRVAEEFIDDTVIKDLGDSIISWADDLEGFKSTMALIRHDFDAFVEGIEATFNPPLAEFDKAVIQPIIDLADDAIMPLVAKSKIMYEDLPEGTKLQLSKLTNDIDTFVGGAYTNLDEGLKAGVRQGLLQAVMGNFGTTEGKAAVTRAFTRELITVQAIKDIDNPAVDVFTAPVLAAGIRTALDAIILDNPDVSDAALQAMAATARTSIQNSLLSGTFSQDFAEWQDKVSGEHALAEDTVDKIEKLEEEAPALEKELADAYEAKRLLEQSLEDAKNLAYAEDSTQADRDAYSALINGDSYFEDLNAVNQRINNATQAVLDLNSRQDSLFVELEERRSNLAGSTQLRDPTVFAYQQNLLKDMAIAINPDMKDSIEDGEYGALHGVTGDAAYMHYITTGAINGVPVTIEEYHSRYDAGLTQLYNYAVNSSGLSDTRLTNAERSHILASINQNIATHTNGEDPVTRLDFMEDNVGYSGYLETTDWNGIVLSGFNNAYENANFSSVDAINEHLIKKDYLAFRDNPNNPLFYLKDFTPAQKDEYLRNLVNDNLFVSAAPSNGTYHWNSAPTYRVFNPATGQIEETRAPALGLNFTQFAELDPEGYYTVLAELPNKEAVAATNNYRVANGSYDLPIDHLDPDFYTDKEEFAVPDSELPWIVRQSRKVLEWRQGVIDDLQVDIDELEAIPVAQRSNEQKRRLQRLRSDIDDANTSILRWAKWAIQIPADFIDYGNKAIISMGLGSQQTEAMRHGELAARKRAAELLGDEYGFGYLIPYDELSPSMRIEIEQVAKDVEKEYLDKIDYTVLNDNDISNTVDMLTNLSNGYLPEAYEEDRDAMYKEWDAAEGGWDKAKAIFGSVVNHPTALLYEFVIPEFGETLIQFGLSRGTGGITKQAAKAMGKDIATAAAGAKVATLGANVLQDVAIEYGATVGESYDEVMNELGKANAAAEINGLPPVYTLEEMQQTAFDVATSAGTVAVLLTGATHNLNFALDNKILNSSSFEVLDTLAERVIDYGTTMGKEALGEVITEVGSQGYVENALYGLGFTDRDVVGNLSEVASIAAITSAGTTTGFYGLSMFTNDVLKDTNDPFAATLVATNPQIQFAIEEKDPILLRNLLTAANIDVESNQPTFNGVMNIVDDTNYVTYLEAQRSYEYIGVDPSEQDIEFAVALKDTSNDGRSLVDQLIDYRVDISGVGSIGTGRTTAQTYDILKHLEDMRTGVVPLDPAFVDTQTGESVITPELIQSYVDNLPQREQDLLAAYDADTHQPTNIVEELGGSLMTQDQIDTFNQRLTDLEAAGLTVAEVITELKKDPLITSIPGNIETMVNNAFADAENRAAFAEEVATKLVNDKTIEGIAETEVSEALGNSAAGKESGIFLILKNLADDIASGDSNKATKSQLNSKIAEVKNLISALGQSTANVDMAFANMLGTSAEGSESGIYLALKNLETGQSTTDDAVAAIEAAYKAADSALSSTVSSLSGVVGKPASENNGKNTGVFLVIEQAIAAGDEAREALLSGYTDLGAFETALNSATDAKIQSIKDTFGTPPVYKKDKDGNIVYKDGEPQFDTNPTGLFLKAYQADQLEGAARDAAMSEMQVSLNQAIADARGFSTSEAARIKTEIINEYFPEPPAISTKLQDAVRDIAYIESMTGLRTGDIGFDPAFDLNNSGLIGPADINKYRSLYLNQAERNDLDAYQSWMEGDSMSAFSARFAVETGQEFSLVENKINALEANISNTLQNDVISKIGKPSDPGKDNATGLYALIQEGDANLSDVIGSIGDDGSGILRDLELAGLSIGEIQTFLTNNVGDPDKKTGLFGVTNANAQAISSLSSTLSTTNNALTEASQRITANATAIATANSAITALENAGYAKETAVQAGLEAAAKALGNTKDELVESIDANSDSIGDITAALEKKVDTTTLTSNMAAVNASIQALENAGFAKETAVQDGFAAAATALGNTKDELAADIGANSTSISDVSNAVSANNNAITTLNAAVTALQTAGSNRDTAIENGLAAAATALGTTKEELANSIGANSTSIADVTAALKTKVASSTYEARVSAVNASILALQNAGSTRDTAIENGLAAAATALGNTKDELVESIGANSDSISDINIALNTANQGISANATAIATANSAITALENAGFAKEDAVQAGLAAAATALGNTKDELIDSIGANSDDIDDINTALGKKVSTSALNTKVTAINAAISALEQAGVGRDTAISAGFSAATQALNTTSENLTNAIGANSEDIDDLDSALSTASQRITANANAIATANSAITALENAGFAKEDAVQAGLEAAAKALNTTKEGLVSSIGANSDDIDDINTALGARVTVETFNGRVTAVNASIEALQQAGLGRDAATKEGFEAAATALGNTKDELANSIGANSTKIGDLDTALGTANGKIADNATAIATLNGAVEALQQAGVDRDTAIEEGLEAAAEALGITKDELAEDIGTNATNISLLNTALLNRTTNVTFTNRVATVNASILALENAGAERDTAIENGFAAAATALGSTKDELAANIGANANDITSIKNGLETTNANIKSNADAVITINAAVEALQQAGVDRDTAITNGFAAAATALGISETALATKIQANVDNIDSINEKLKGFVVNSSFAGLNTKVTAMAAAISALEGQGTSRDAAISSGFAAATTALNTTKDALAKDIGANSTAVNDLNIALSAKITDNADAILVVKAAITALEGAGVERDTAITNGFEAAATALGNTKDELVESIGANSDSIAAINIALQGVGVNTEALEGTNTRLIAIDASIQALQQAGVNRDTAIENGLAAAATALGNTKDELATSIGANANDISSINDTLTNGLVDVGKNTAAIATINSAVTALENAGFAKEDAVQAGFDAATKALGTTKDELAKNIGANANEINTISAALEKKVSVTTYTDKVATLTAAIEALEGAGFAKETAVQDGFAAAATSLGNTKDALAADIGANSTAVSDLNNALSTANQNIANNTTAVATANSAIKALQDAGVARDTAIEQGFEAAAKALGTTKDALAADIGANADNIESINNALSGYALQVDLDKTDAGIVVINTTIEALQKAGLGRDTAIENGFAAAATALGNTKDELATSIGANSTKIGDINTALSTANQKIADNATAIATANSAITALENAGFAKEAAVQAGLEAAAEALGNTKDELLDSIGANSDSIDDINLALEKKVDTTALNTKVSAINASILALENAGTERDTAIENGFSAATQALNTTSENLTNAIGANSTKIDDLSTALEQSDQKITDNANAIATANAAISALQNAGVDRDTAIENGLAAAATALGTTKDELIDSIGANSDSIDDINSALTARVTVDTFNGRVTAVNASILALENAGSARDTAIENGFAAASTALGNTKDELATSIGANSTKIGDLDTALDTANQRITANANAIATANSAITALENAGFAKETAVQDGLAAAATALGTTKDQLLETIGANSDSVADVTAALATKVSVTTFDAKLATVNAAISALEQAGVARDTAIEDGFKGAAEALGILESKLAVDIGANTSNVADIKVALEGVTAETTSLRADLTAATDRLTIAEDKVQTLEDTGATDTELNAAKAEVDQAKEDINTINTALEGKADVTAVTELSEAQTELSTAQQQTKDAVTVVSEEVDALEKAGLDRDTAIEEGLQNAAEALGTTKQELAEDIGANSTAIQDINQALTNVATKSDINMLADLIGKDPRYLTQEDINLAESYLLEAEADYVALYDVNNDGTFNDKDLSDMKDAFTTDDYSAIAESQFGPQTATGMVGQNLQAQMQLEEAQNQLEVERQQAQEAQLQRDAEFQTKLQEQLRQQDRERLQREYAKAFTAEGREVTEQEAPLADIGYMYDIGGDNIFATDQQRGFYSSASPFGDNFLNDIILPQQRRAKGGMIKDKTDEILKIIGDK